MQIIKNELNNFNTIILTISINKEDYKNQLEKLIIEKKKNVKIHGFRKGKIPINIIRNKYENTLKIQYIEKLLNKYIYDYIIKENIKIIGDVLLIKQEVNNLDNLLFQFEIGIRPEFNLEINNLDIYYYNIIFSNEEIDNYIKKIKNYFNKIESDIIYNKNGIKSEEEFRSKIELEINKIFSIKSNELFFNLLISILLKKIKINLPKDFLKRWIQKKYLLSIDKINEQYQNIEKEICKELIINKLFNFYKIDNLKNKKEKNINNLEDIIKKIIKNEDNIHIFSNLYLSEIISILKKKLNIKNKNCSLNEFKDLLKKLDY